MTEHKVNLKGLRILNTRPPEDANEFSRQIKAAYGCSVDLPLVAVRATSPAWIKSLPNLRSFQQAVFISKNSVRYFFKELQANNIVFPKNLKVNCVGTGTAYELQKLGVTVEFIPNESTSESLIQLSNMQNISDQKILLVKGVAGRDLIANTITAKGAILTTIEVYERILPLIDIEYVNSIWHDDAVDIILFTSKQAMLNILKIFPSQAHAWIFSKSCVVISQRLANAAKNIGFKKIIQTPYPKTLSALQGYEL